MGRLGEFQNLFWGFGWLTGSTNDDEQRYDVTTSHIKKK